MPKKKDIKSILIIGAGPIVIGQACEFDYSGTQACRALKEEGYRIILVNSNPATIMTDKELADATYLEPINTQSLASIIEKERPDAILPTVGGQTGLDAAMKLYKEGILDPQGATVSHALESMNVKNIDSLTIGKFIEMNFTKVSKEEASAIADESWRKLLANPNIETYEIEIVEK